MLIEKIIVNNSAEYMNLLQKYFTNNIFLMDIITLKKLIKEHDTPQNYPATISIVKNEQDKLITIIK